MKVSELKAKLANIPDDWDISLEVFWDGVGDDAIEFVDFEIGDGPIDKNQALIRPVNNDRLVSAASIENKAVVGLDHL